MEIATSTERRGLLPRSIVLKSDTFGKYLRFIHENVQNHGFVQFSGDEVVSPYSKLEVEQAKSGSGLVHIRCSYNNKYLVRWSRNHWWIVAGADEPEEDLSQWSCTLFEPHYNIDGDANKIALMHVQLKHYLLAMPQNIPEFHRCLFAGTWHPSTEKNCVFSLVDWDTLLVLPKRVTFKNNDRYLQGVWSENRQYLQFAATDIGLPTVGNEVFTTPTGAIRIRNDHFTRFWRRGWNWIWASDLTINEHPDTLFWPVKVGDNVVALRNLGNNMFVKSHTYEGKTNCLNAAYPTISNESRFEVHELVLSREIYNVTFRLMDARIYSQVPTTMTSGKLTNRTTQMNHQKVTVTYTESKSSTWSASVSLKLGVSTTIRTGVPFIAQGQVTIETEFSGAYEWGGSRESTKQVSTTYEVDVPPMTAVDWRLLATTGTCDVPFSYTQRDILTNGEPVTYEMDDGIYTGISSYNSTFETEETKL